MSGRTDYEAKDEDPGLDTVRVLVEEKKACVTKVSGAINICEIKNGARNICEIKNGARNICEIKSGGKNICEIKNGVDAETRQTSIRCSRFTTLQCEATWRWSFKSLFLCRRHKIVLLLSKVVEFLVKQQAIDLNCQDKQVGWNNSQAFSIVTVQKSTPLHIAATYGHKEVTQSSIVFLAHQVRISTKVAVILLKAGADCTKLDYKNQNPLHKYMLTTKVLLLSPTGAL